MRVDALAALVPFATLGDVEQIIVDAIKHKFLAVSSWFRGLLPRSWGRTNAHSYMWLVCEAQCLTI